MNIRYHYFLALTLASATLAACGSSKDEKLSKAEYIKKADVICAKYAKQGATYKKKVEAAINSAKTPEETLKKFASVSGEGKTILENQRKELKALGDPAEGADQIKRAFASSDAVIDQIDKITSLAQNATTDDFAKIEQASKDLQTLTAKSNSQLSDFGFKECGKN